MRLYVLALLVVLAVAGGQRLLQQAHAEPAAHPQHAESSNQAHVETKPTEATHPEAGKVQGGDAAHHEAGKPAEATHEQHKPTETVNADHHAEAAGSQHSSPTAVHPDGAGQHPVNTDHVVASEQHNQVHHQEPHHEQTQHQTHQQPIHEQIHIEQEPITQGSLQNDRITQQLMKKAGILDKEEQRQQLAAEQLETQAHKQQVTQHEQQLDLWIQRQKHQYELAQRNHVSGERFEFIIDSEMIDHFYFDASTNKPGNDIHIDIVVYIQVDSSYYIPNRPAKDTHLTFSIVYQDHNVLLEKNIYSAWSTEFKPHINEGFNLYFQNNYGQTLMVLVNIERLNKTVETHVNKLDPMTQMLQMVFEEMEETYNEDMKQIYKSQLGFKEKEDDHMHTMLMLTGLELLAIVSTAIVQMFCLRNLLENRSIV